MSGNYILLFPIVWPMLGGVMSFLAGRASKRLRDYIADVVALVELAAVCHLGYFLGDGQASFLRIDGFCVFGLSLKLDGFRFVYLVVIAFMWLVTTIFSREYLAHYRNRNRYHLFVLWTLGAIVGVFLSANLYTTFIFFELMSLTSLVMVIQDETRAALRAAETYLAITIIGGLVTLLGLLLLYAQTGTLDMALLPIATASMLNRSELYLAGVLIFVGFGAKAAVFPLHVWLPTAHPVAPAPSSALLSGVLTKSGLFGILVLSTGIFLHNALWGLMLLALGVSTMVVGAVLALFSVDIKRTLACSSMSQIGFILTGISMQCFLGEDNALAVQGTMVYMVNHSLVKLVLFLVAGIIHMNTGKLNLNEIRGYGRGKPLLLFVFSMGALGLAGVPLWSGYVGKTLIHESIVEHIHQLHAPERIGAISELLHSGLFTLQNEVVLFQAVEWIFLISGALTAAYMFKLFAALFLSEPAGHPHSKRAYVSTPNAVLLTLAASVLPLLGLFPQRLMTPIGALGSPFMNGHPPTHPVDYFAWANLKGAVLTLTLGAAFYFLIVYARLMRREPDGHRRYIDPWPKWLDLERTLYRPILTGLLPFLGAFLARLVDFLCDGLGSWLFSRGLPFLIAFLARVVDLLCDGFGSWSFSRGLPFLSTLFARAASALCDSPISWLLSRTSNRRSTFFPESSKGFAAHSEINSEKDIPSFRTSLPSSLAYSLLTFALGLLFVLLYLLG